MADNYGKSSHRYLAHRNIFWLLVLISTFALPVKALAQPIDTNRPGFSFSPNIVQPGQWQIETGISYTRDTDDSYTTSLPLAEIRTGVSGRAEVFLSSLSWSRSSFDSGSNSGLVDTTVGTKFKVSREEAPTQMALLLQVSVPTGNSNFSSDRWDPSAAFIWSHGGKLAIMGTAKVSYFSSGFQLDNSFKLPFAWSDTQSAFVEWEANLPEEGGNTHWLNGGYQWLIEEHIQFDLNVGLGLNDRAADYRLGIGFSIRL